ncbi:surface protease GP63 [Trypanosoma cruzi]|nr:surface protease GP63 [Trypanosoma cruzi]
MHIAVDLAASFVVHAGSCVWRLLSSSVDMGRTKVRGSAHPESLFLCGCVTPRVTSWSEAPHHIEGGTAVKFWYRVMDESGSTSTFGWCGDCLLGVRSVLAAGLWPCSVGCGIELGAVAVRAFFVWEKKFRWQCRSPQRAATANCTKHCRGKPGASHVSLMELLLAQR